jgi:hypothetical protein
MSYRKKAHKHALDDMEECLIDINFESYKPLLFSHETNWLNSELGLSKAPIIKERKRVYKHGFYIDPYSGDSFAPSRKDQIFSSLENKAKYEWREGLMSDVRIIKMDNRIFAEETRKQLKEKIIAERREERREKRAIEKKKEQDENERQYFLVQRESPHFKSHNYVLDSEEKIQNNWNIINSFTSKRPKQKGFKLSVRLLLSKGYDFNQYQKKLANKWGYPYYTINNFAFSIQNNIFNLLINND